MYMSVSEAYEIYNFACAEGSPAKLGNLIQPPKRPKTNMPMAPRALQVRHDQKPAGLSGSSRPVVPKKAAASILSAENSAPIIVQADTKDTVVIIDVEDPYDPARPNSYEDYRQERDDEEFLRSS
jgi:hypothetical protein